MSSILIEHKQPIITQPTFIDRNDMQTNENLIPLKTIDYNSIAEEIVERNESAIDAVVQTHLKTEIVTTPEPSEFFRREITQKRQYHLQFAHLI